MRKVIVLLLLLLPLMMQAKDRDDKKKKKIVPKRFLPGRWIEVKRTTLDSVEYAFTDTLFMTFQVKDTFTYRTRNGFVYRGKYTIDDTGHLDFGTVSYNLAMYRYNVSTVLVGSKGISYYVPDTSALPPEVVLEKEDKILPVTDPDVMIGHWTVYKRGATDKENSAIVDPEFNIKSAYITGGSSDNTIGVLFCGNDPDNAPSFIIRSLTPDQSLECEGKRQRFVKVVKCQKGELVLEDAGVTYYMKQFK